MTDKKFKNMKLKTEGKAFDICKKLATYTTDNDVTDFDGKRITGVERSNFIEVLSMDMAMGALITKNRYLLLGGISGVILTSGLLIAYNKFKKSKEVES